MDAMLSLDGETLRFAADGRAESRRLDAAAVAELDAISNDYRKAVERNLDDAMFGIGERLSNWFDGSQNWMALLTGGVGRIEFCVEVGADPDAIARSLIDAPWELLSGKNEPLAFDDVRYFCPMRRIGRRVASSAPAHRDIGLLFMAAAPRGADNLQYEAEENAFLEAVPPKAHVGVEESGCLEFLVERMAGEAMPFDVLHISCHGDIDKNGNHFLLLEDEAGAMKPATAADLAHALGDPFPPMVFLSACRTAEQELDATPLVIDLIRAGAQTVLGWDGSVQDGDAIRFARSIYRDLGLHKSPAHAQAVARRELIEHRRQQGTGLGRHWHLARVYAGPSGGGPLTSAKAAARPAIRLDGQKEFLDKKGGRVAVASASEFAGRRRQAQEILRDFRESSAGVLIHGMGRLGKSSLAARIAHRMRKH